MSPSIGESTQSYEPGDVIMQIQRPLVHVTKYEHRLFTCDHCFNSTESSVVCSGCRKVYYCSKECQTKAWDHQDDENPEISIAHKIECEILRKHPPMEFENQGVDYMQRLTLRLYLLLSKLKNGEMMAGGQQQILSFNLTHNGQQRTIEQMETHREQLKNTDYFRGILNYFRYYQIDYDSDLLLQCYGILHVNSFGIDCYDSANHSIEHRGTGLYIEASVFDHSCVPNACASGDGLMLEIRALAPIRPGQLIYIDYVQDVLPKQQRIESLENRYFFTCQCEFGCQPGADAFDSKIDFKRYAVLNNLLETLNKQQQEHQCYDFVTTGRLYDIRRQRLSIQEQYYARCQYHPCLSLFYQSFLRFLILNHERLDGIEEEINRITMKCREHLAITHGRQHQFYQWTIGQFDNQAN